MSYDVYGYDIDHLEDGHPWTGSIRQAKPHGMSMEG